MDGDPTPVPAPVVLVIAGSASSALPVARPQLSAVILFDLVIPPPLYAASVNTSLFGLRQNKAVTSLSALLVLLSTFAVAATVSWGASEGGVCAGSAARTAWRRSRRNGTRRAAARSAGACAPV